MVLPDGTSGAPTPERPKSRSGLFVIAATLLGCGALLFALLTTPGEIQAVGETTTTTRPLPPPTRPTLVNADTFSVDQIETGTQLSWLPAGTIGHFYPYDIVEFDGNYYVLASASNQWTREPGGLAVWRSTDGTNWVTLGEVIETTHKISAVTSTPQGLFAVEPGDGSFTVWRSQDGETWGPETVEVDTDVEFGSAYPQQIAGNDRLLVVHGHVQFEPIALLEAAIEETYGTSIDLTEYGYSPQFGSDDTILVVHGPLGIPILTVSAQEMGLTEEQRTAIQNGHIEQASVVWASWDGGEWTQGQIEDLGWVNSVVPRDDGSLLAVGWGDTGANIWVTYDGLAWEEQRVHPEPSFIEPWGDSFVGPDSIGDASIVTSNDGIEWVETGVEQHLPRPIGWNIGPIATGEAGIAAFVNGWKNEPFTEEATPDPPVLQDGDLTVTLDFRMGRIGVAYLDQTRELGMWGNSLQEGLAVDLEEERVVFSNPETDEEWGSFSFDALRQAEESYWPRGPGESFPAFVHSTDGVAWNVQSLSDELGMDNPHIVAMEMTDDGRVIAAVFPERLRFVQEAPGFEIWTADLP